MSNKKYHYTYLITEISTGMKYIGVRSCNNLPEKDIGITYFSSSSNKNFIKNQKENKNNYKYEVLQTFETRREAILNEIELHEKYCVDNDSNFYNIVKSSNIGLDTTNKTTVKDKNNNIFLVDINDPRLKTGELVGQTKGFINVYDINGNMYFIDKTDDRIGKTLFHNRKNMINTYDKYGNKYYISCNDERYKNGSLISIKNKWYLYKNNLYSINELINIFHFKKYKIYKLRIKFLYNNIEIYKIDQ